MTQIKTTKHAVERMAQRTMSMSDAEFIVMYGTEVPDGFLFLARDCDALEGELKRSIEQVRRLRGKRVVAVDGKIVTVFHSSARTERRLIRNAEERLMEMAS